MIPLKAGDMVYVVFMMCSFDRWDAKEIILEGKVTYVPDVNYQRNTEWRDGRLYYNDSPHDGYCYWGVKVECVVYRETDDYDGLHKTVVNPDLIFKTFEEAKEFIVQRAQSLKKEDVIKYDESITRVW